MSKTIKISSTIEDDKNFNRHTAEGMDLLEKSVKQNGVLEAVTISEDGKVIKGRRGFNAQILSIIFYVNCGRG